jgi:hypothetical protein
MAEQALTVMWEGRQIGQFRVTERETRSGFARPGRPDAPLTVNLKGSFTPASAFLECVGYFDECNRRERVYQTAAEGDALSAADEALREAMLPVLDRVRVPEIAGRLRNFWIEGRQLSLIYEPLPGVDSSRAEPGTATDGGA